MCAKFFVCWGQGTKRQLQRGVWHMKDDAKQNTTVMPHKAPTTRTVTSNQRERQRGGVVIAPAGSIATTIGALMHSPCAHGEAGCWGAGRVLRKSPTRPQKVPRGRAVVAPGMRTRTLREPLPAQ
jgi:hypothetical protein